MLGITVCALCELHVIIIGWICILTVEITVSVRPLGGQDYVQSGDCLADKV